MYRVACLLAIALLFAAPSHPANAQKLSAPDIATFRKEVTEVTVQSIIDPQTFVGQDQKIYRLSGIDLPGLYDQLTVPEWIGLAKEALSSRILGKTLKIYQSKTPANRTSRLGQTLVHAVEKTNGTWLQGWLLEQGYARAFPTDMAPEAAQAMYKLESKARLARKGLWALPENAVLDSANAARAIGKSGIVTGQIRSVTQQQSMLYLNFGTDWKSDFTIGIPARLRQVLARQNIDPRTWAGQHIMVRGYVSSYYGPFINLLTESQVALIAGEQPAGAATPPPASAATQDAEANNTGLQQYIVTEKAGPAAPPKEQANEQAKQEE